ncbi:sulfatase-like hydrolase/transferase [Stratiformator vulcanicus]|uniref:Arylsulfatase n=1 Tax=Stratiformator vulcanicus TaxID=2527980 RepID=A0A517R165_9PLAN|nr:sulfatase-like hydrolase/transferase [Stratiformator vulcanicus]QDT37637.1 Arylsulfatase [Stratiformator vulcanicus]
MLRYVIFCLALIACAGASAAERPNFVFVLIDDMGWGDLSCFGSEMAETPQLDKLAAAGIRFEQFYVNSPICSPSRAAFLTGRYPQRDRIGSYLSHRKHNRSRGIADWLDPEVPTLSALLQQAGYATGHFGKWHLGGQRDVEDAPQISQYGFDKSLTNFEGLGPKLLPITLRPGPNGEVIRKRIWSDAERLGGPVEWRVRSKITSGFADAAIQFIGAAQAKDQPFYVNVWPDDVHTPLFPSPERWSEETRDRYVAVLEEMDNQFAPLLDRIRGDAKLRDNTVILVCSDNGPEQNCGTAGPFRGIKATLLEGGIRSPLIVWAPGLMPPSSQGTRDQTSVLCALDIAPSLAAIAGVEVSEGAFRDGENLSATLLGQNAKSRSGPIFFRRPPDRKDYRFLKNLPDLAVRSGEWKLLCDYDGQRPQLYRIEDDAGESNNLAPQRPDVTNRLTNLVIEWNAKLPPDAAMQSATSRQ